MHLSRFARVLLLVASFPLWGGQTPPAARAFSFIVNTETGQPTATPTDFFIAAANGDNAGLDVCLRAGIPADSPTPQPPPPELVAAVGPRSHAAVALREGNATALMLATASGQLDAAAILLAAGADRYARTAKGTRPLDLAAQRGDIPAMRLLLNVKADSAAERLSILVDLTAQRAVVSRDGVEVFTTKISSGKKDKPTPPGTYVITQKYPMWRSSLYNNAAMPFFLRLSCSAVGLHQGNLPGYPASHGCVRLPEASAKKLFAEVPLGTVVTIR